MNENLDLPYVIFEVANVHGGNRDRLFSIVEEYKKIDYKNKAIKFQPLKPEQISLPDFQWFKVYQELYFEPQVWQDVIALAAEGGEVWLDLFDAYGVQVLNENKQHVVGIKLQASVLDNIEVINALSSMELKHLRLIINISGYEISSVEQYVKNFNRLGFHEIILQIGFQSYPTLIADTGMQKIPVLKAAFPSLHLCIADHASAEMLVARQIPAWATIAGCTYVEKHFCLRRSDSKYDHYSALEPDEFREMLRYLSDSVMATHGSFVSSSEVKYLKSSYQAPIARHDLALGSLIGLSDLSFRRTNQKGLTWADTLSEQSQFQILTDTVHKDSVFTKTNFKRAKIGAIVACRMKSSRLKNKALLPIHGVSSVERCLQNCLKMPHIDLVVLATSTLDEDSTLENHTVGGVVKFWRGDPDDVIQRYLGACEQYGIDVVVRVTADCPVVSPEITDFLLKSHFEAGADYTGSKNSAVGSSPEIYNVEALRRVIALLGKADYSEYMTWYMRNNADIFKVNIVDIPIELQRSYRLTLDYPEDLEMFNRLYSALDDKKLDSTLTNVFSVMDVDDSISNINQHLTLTYQTDNELINKLNNATRISTRTDAKG
jgi:N,N'-diacetyllegionaminate synthase